MKSRKEKLKVVLLIGLIISFICLLLIFFQYDEVQREIQEIRYVNELLEATHVTDLEICNYWNYEMIEERWGLNPVCYNTPKDMRELTIEEYDITKKHLRTQKTIAFENPKIEIVGPINNETYFVNFSEIFEVDSNIWRVER